MNVSITEKQREYIDTQLAGGDYQNASELVRDALRLHQSYRHKILEDLRMEIAKGWSGELSERSAKDIVQSKLEGRQG